MRTLTAVVFLFAAATLAAQDPAAPPEPDDELVITATRRPEAAFWLPAATTRVGAGALGFGADGRGLPHALRRAPSVLLQKTGPGQTSPFVRGWTGFRTLTLVDGVRLNNSVWRSGPNQYVGTLDPWAFGSLELVRGPGAVLWGSDAVGGTLHARTAAPDATRGWSTTYALRWASAERAGSHRVEVEGGDPGRYAVRAGISDKTFGNLRSGAGDLPGTGYDERDADLRLDLPLEDDLALSVVAQRVRQNDVPRTHKTVESVPYRGTTVGSELSRDLDQERDLLYARLDWSEDDAFYDSAAFTVSYQRTGQRQERRRTGARFDVQEVDVDTFGASLQLDRAVDHGLLSFGVDAYRDEVDSSRRDVLGGVSTGAQIQGPVADDSSYELLGVYVQDEIAHHDGLTTTLGLRYSHARAKAGRVDNPNVAGSSPGTPGNILRLDESFSALVGSVRTLVPLDARSNAWLGVSQGFRAPNLSDLSSELEDSGSESPTPNLDPEHFVTFEVGVRTEQDAWEAELVVHYTEVRDTILNSPTGAFDGGTPVVTKSNVGDGRVRGVELSGEWRVHEEYALYAAGSWLDGSIRQFRADGTRTRGPLDRQQPLSGVLGVAHTPADSPWRWEADVFLSDTADELSIRDTTDTQRIPPGGTPGYSVFGVRGRRALGSGSFVEVGLENLFDRNYRVHGSGQNEPGRNLVVSLRKRWGRG